ncbi:MAG TPA: family 16 glycoside hydrolase [Armatimonadota bacterium]
MKSNRSLVGLFLAPGLTIASLAGAQGVRIDVKADQVVHPVSRLLTGACLEDVNHEIYGGFYSQMVFGESFQEPPLPQPIAGFTPFGGQWNVRDGVVSIAGGDGPKLVSSHTPFGDASMSVDLLFKDRTGGNAGLVVRTTNPGVGADSFTGYEVSLDAARQMVILARHRRNFEPIEEAPCEVAVGKWIPLEVRLAGPAIEVLVDGKSVLRHDDGANALPAGTVALRAWQREASYRNLRVKAGDSTEPLAFEERGNPSEVSGMWRVLTRGNATGRCAIITENPFVGTQSQRLTFESGIGEFGVENQGLSRRGMNIVKGKPYTGSVWVRAGKPTTLFASLESRDGAEVYAERPLAVDGATWRHIDFSLTPNAADKAGRFSLKLKQPGSVEVGYAFLQPGEWGRFKKLPVRRDVAEGLIGQGITVMRYGGSMINHRDYRWKKMIGARANRPPSSGTWYPYSSNGWGIPDFMDYAEAAGCEYIPDFNVNETPQDMADFIEYAKGSVGSEWGRKRGGNGHRPPYSLKYIELGNEERVDDNYYRKFKGLAEAIWAADPDITIVVGDFQYEEPIRDPFNIRGADSGITTLAAQQKILRLAKQHDREVWFDLHVFTEGPRPGPSLAGMFSYIDALGRIADGARFKVVVFELNAGNHAQKRALANALAINAIERDGRLPVVTSANCLQPDGQNDNGWDQGLLFLNPSQVWLQPPGYVTQMLARNYLPQLVKCEVTPAENQLDANATASEDGKTVVLQVVNPTNEVVTAEIHLAGFIPMRAYAETTELSGGQEAVNTATDPRAIVPIRGRWKHGMKDGISTRTFPPYSFTIIRLS